MAIPTFKLKHNIISSTAENHAINNFPGVDKETDPCLTFEKIRENLHKLHYYCVNPILQAFGANEIAITSAYRSIELNKRLNGLPNSPHIKGQAIDLVCVTHPTSLLWNWCFQNLSSYHQLIWEYPEDGIWSREKQKFSWVSLSYIEGNNIRTSSMTSRREDLHEIYAGEKTKRKGHSTHNIRLAEEALI